MESPRLLPCKICGATNYMPSFGGPGICPKCDCGAFDAHTLALHNNRLTTQLARQRELLRQIADELRYYPFSCSCLIYERECTCRAGRIDKWLNSPDLELALKEKT
jgi:hypothetical protein